MALQWAILAYIVAAEAAIAVILTLPWPRLLKSRVVALASLILQPAAGVLPFAAFQLMDLYWKSEHRLICSGEGCTDSERNHYEKSIYKAQRNVVLCILTCLLYWNFENLEREAFKTYVAALTLYKVERYKYFSNLISTNQLPLQLNMTSMP